MTSPADLPTEGCESKIVAPDVPCATHNVLVQALDIQLYRMIQEQSTPRDPVAIPSK